MLDAYVSTHFAAPVATVVRPALATAAALTLIGGVAGWIMGRHRGPALASIAGACLLVDMPTAGPEIAAILLPVGVVVLDRLLRVRGRILPWASVTRGMNAFAAVLVALALLQWANSGGLTVLGRDLRSVPDPAPTTRADLPDVYIILLDGYPREDSLRQYFGFDNSSFASTLEGLGLEDYPSSIANYPNTTLTLASMFNFAYVQDQARLRAVLAGREPAQPAFRGAIQSGEAFASARAAGYEVVGFDNGWEELEIPGNRMITTSGLNQFEVALLRDTAYGRLAQFLMPNIFGDQRRSHIEGVLSSLPALAAERTGRPKLVFAHVPSPHYPIVYGEHGDPVVVTVEDLWWYRLDDPAALRRTFSDQLRHLNDLTTSAVSGIARNARPGSVIVVMSDHGSLTGLGPQEERLRNITFAITPGHPGLFGPRPTRINLVAQILNTYAGTDVPILPPHSYGFGHNEQQFIELRP